MDDAQVVGPVDPDERIEVSVLLRPPQPLAELDARLSEPAARALSREEFATAYGADPADLARVQEFARQHRLKVVESSLPRRTVRLAGRTDDINAAFGVQLETYRLPGGTPFRSYAGPISVPTDLRASVQGVFGLDDRPIAQRR